MILEKGWSERMWEYYQAALSNLPHLRDLVAIGAAIAGGIAAMKGLRTWQRQLRANTELEVARAVLRSVYNLREKVEVCRSPMVWTSEMVAAISETKGVESVSDEDLEKWHRPVYGRRWSSVYEEYSGGFETARVEAEILWPAFRDVSSNLEKVIRTLSVAVSEYIRYHEQDMRRTLKPESLEILRGHDEIVQGMPGDDFSKKLEGAIKEIEDFVRPKIEKATPPLK